MRLANTQLELEENQQRLKIVLPVKRNWLGVVAYTLLVIVWLVILVLFLVYLIRPPFPTVASTTYRFVWRLLIIIWLLIWGRTIGRFVLRWWQFYLAQREILFINQDVLIIRRPVSIFGLTDAYDMRYVSPFYQHEQHRCPAFRYGNTQRILFGLGLPPAESDSLLHYLNRRYFPSLQSEEQESA